ncbi:MAG: nucleotidyltransferase domain-containing protein [Pseudomonadota bacterium]|jgi:predicted nucleotidyltransferase
MQSLAQVDHATVCATRAFVGLVARRYDLSAAILYGSRARGTHAPGSDADVAVLLKGRPEPYLDTKLALADLAYDVMLETGIRISPLPVWTEEWEHPDAYSNPALLHNIAREGVRL